MSEGYDNEGENDRLGKAIDGHVHEYDTIHGVTYVDLFQLETSEKIYDAGCSERSIQPALSLCSRQLKQSWFEPFEGLDAATWR